MPDRKTQKSTEIRLYWPRPKKIVGCKLINGMEDEMTVPIPQNPYKKAVSEFFDSRTKYSRSELHRRMANRLIQLANPQPGEQVLDIATGTGFVSIPVGRLVGQQGAVVGVDISAGMLKQANEAIQVSALNNIELVHTDAENLDLPYDRFDLITCCNALPYLSNVPAALRHWYKLLRPGGRLVFNCWSENSHATGHLLQTIAVKHGIQVAIVGHDTGTPERCRSALKNAGFTKQEITIEPTSNYWSADYLEAVFDSALQNPLFGLTPRDRSLLTGLRDEYMQEANTSHVKKSIDDEKGAYFALAYK